VIEAGFVADTPVRRAPALLERAGVRTHTWLLDAFAIAACGLLVVVIGGYAFGILSVLLR
jgi:hypothetical protein